MFSTPAIPAAPAAVAGASTTVAVARAADVDDAVAVAATTAEGLVAAGRSLRFALRAVDSWRADRGHAGCLCRAADELRIAARLVDGITPLTLRRSATWRDPLDDVLYPVGSITRVLGRTARLLRSLARGGATVRRHHGAGRRPPRRRSLRPGQGGLGAHLPRTGPSPRGPGSPYLVPELAGRPVAVARRGGAAVRRLPALRPGPGRPGTGRPGLRRRRRPRQRRASAAGGAGGGDSDRACAGGEADGGRR
ncbi:hypothetical protein ACU686_22605 [Yinghuangia aomiensis]